MAEKNNTLLALVAVLLFSAIGFVLSNFIRDLLTNMTASGIVADLLNFITTPGLFEGILWLIVCIVIYIGAGKAFASGENIGPISPTFLLLWIFTNLGLLIGFILWLLIQGGNVTLDLDVLYNSLLSNLTLSLGPTFAAALGISNKT